MVRIKHRYLLVNILYPNAPSGAGTTVLKAESDLPYTVQFHQPTSDRVDTKMLLHMIRNGVSELFGDYGSGMTSASLQIKYFSPATSTAIIRVSRDHYRLVWAALTFTLQLPKPIERPCVLQVVRVSGTIRKAEEEAIRRAQLSIRRARAGSGLKDSVSGVHTGAGFGPDGAMDDRFASGIEDVDEDDEDDDDEGRASSAP